MARKYDENDKDPEHIGNVGYNIAIIAGGFSTRFGVNKAVYKLNGKSFINIALDKCLKLNPQPELIIISIKDEAQAQLIFNSIKEEFLVSKLAEINDIGKNIIKFNDKGMDNVKSMDDDKDEYEDHYKEKEKIPRGNPERGEDLNLFFKNTYSQKFRIEHFNKDETRNGTEEIGNGNMNEIIFIKDTIDFKPKPQENSLLKTKSNHAKDKKNKNDKNDKNDKKDKKKKAQKKDRPAASIIGFHSVFNFIKTGTVFLMPIDIPFLSVNAMQHLINEFTKEGHNFHALIPAWNNGFIEPLIALYKTQFFVDNINQNIQRGDLKIRNIFKNDEHVLYYKIEENLSKYRNINKQFRNINFRSDL